MIRHPETAEEKAAAKWVSDNPPGLDPVRGDDGYPTDIELWRIEMWGQDEKLSRTMFIEQIAYVRERWQYADVGYWQTETDKDGGIFYAISTGGWSGNESLMGALRDSYFGMFCFESHFRGGHYTFKLKAWKETTDAEQAVVAD